MNGIVTKQGFEPDHKEFGLHIRSAIAQRPALNTAKRIANVANGNAPFRPKKKGDRRRRHLKGSYSARPDGNLRLGRWTRAIAVVESPLIEAATKEFGTSTQKPEYPLLRAAFSTVPGADIRVPGGMGQGGA